MTELTGGATLERRRARASRLFPGLPYWLVLPALGYLVFFLGWPMVQSFVLAFQVDGEWTTANLSAMVHDVEFEPALRFTLLLVLVSLPLQFLVAFGMALLINTPFRGRGFVVYCCVLPIAVSDLAAGIVWSAIFTQNGYLNTILQLVGLQETPTIWIDSQNESMLLMTIVVTELWRGTALIVLILVAGLQSIDHEYMDAASVFGATPLQRVWHVVLPMLKPAFQVALIIKIVVLFEVFGSVIAIAGAGATVLAAEAFRSQVVYFNTNVAAAYGCLILVLSLLSVGLVLRVVRVRREQLPQ